MKRAMGIGVLALSLLCTRGGWADGLESGPQPGEKLGAYEVKKCAGNANDGVDAGEQLCYRCKLGNRPVVAVFARTADESLTQLVKALDTVVADHEEQKMASFVNLLGEDTTDLQSQAKQVVEKSGAEHVAVVIPEDHENGPPDYKLNPRADVTVLVYKGGVVQANFAFPSGGLKQDKIRQITESAEKMLN